MEYIQSKWQLEDLYPEDYKEAFQSDIDTLRQKAETFTKYRSELNPDIAPERFVRVH